jgi:hypothetical protein
MGLVSGMTLGSDGHFDPSSGVLSLYAWEPTADDLFPSRYDYDHPDAGSAQASR